MTPLLPEDDPEGFAALVHKVLREHGFDLAQYKPNYLRRRVAVRMRAIGATSYQGYLERMDESEFRLLHDRITIHVTEFFRDAEAFELLRKEVLPALGARLAREGAQEAWAWSAGCSTGEEPYSLAMMMDEALSPLGLAPRILATDIDQAVLEKARRGIYPAKDVRGLKEAWKRRYVHERADDRLEIDGALRRMVSFREHHLLAAPPPKGMDLILCRNVMIYFSKEQHQPLFSAFHKALNPGGILVLGKTESMMGRAREGFSCLSARERVYQRQETAL